MSDEKNQDGSQPSSPSCGSDAVGLGEYSDVIAERRMPIPCDHFIALSKALTVSFGELLVRQRGEYCQWVRQPNSD